MHKKIEFSEYGEKNKLRVMDVTKTKPPLYYDKKMTTILLCMEYSEAFAKNAVDKGLQIKMYALIDEVFNGFTPALDTSRAEYKTIIKNINTIKEQDRGYNLLEAYEFICLQLTVLGKVSNEKYVKDKRVDVKKVFETPIDKIDAGPYLRKLVIAQSAEDDSDKLRNIIPVYSSSATIGMNTILFSIFNGYMPVGVGEKPYEVHNEWLKNMPILHLVHDFGHTDTVLKSQQQDPEAFEKYRKIYFELFENKKQNKIDDKMFKQSVLVLFFLAYDSAHSHPFATFQEVEKSINTCLYLLLSDYKTPLKDLGYSIDTKESLRECLLVAVKEFVMNYPYLKISPLAKAESHTDEGTVSRMEDDIITKDELPVNATIPQIEPLPSIDRAVLPLTPTAKKNDYIIKPIMDLLESAIEKICIIRDAQNTQIENFRKFIEAISLFDDAVDVLKNKIHDETLQNSETLVDVLHAPLQIMKKLPQLRRLLKSVNPPMDFDKEYPEAMKLVDARHKATLNSVENITKVSSHSMFKKKESEGNELKSDPGSSLNLQSQ